MNIPEKVRVGYIDCNVELINNSLVDCSQEIYGRIDYSYGKITLSNIFCKDQVKAALIHECVHGLDIAYDIKLKEEQVEKLGIAFYTFIKDNPDVFKKLIPVEEEVNPSEICFYCQDSLTRENRKSFNGKFVCNNCAGKFNATE